LLALDLNLTWVLKEESHAGSIGSALTGHNLVRVGILLEAGGYIDCVACDQEIATRVFCGSHNIARIHPDAQLESLPE
jgi:hypothetical protein